jgi:hypothetical protein
VRILDSTWSPNYALQHYDETDHLLSDLTDNAENYMTTTVIHDDVCARPHFVAPCVRLPKTRPLTGWICLCLDRPGNASAPARGQAPIERGIQPADVCVVRVPG